MSCYPACALGSRVSQAMFHSVIRIYRPILSLCNDWRTRQGMPVSFRSDLQCTEVLCQCVGACAQCALGSLPNQLMFYSVIRIYRPVLSLWNDCRKRQGIPVSFRSDLLCIEV